MKELLTQYELALELMYNTYALTPEADSQACAVASARINLLEMVIQDIKKVTGE